MVPIPSPPPAIPPLYRLSSSRRSSSSLSLVVPLHPVPEEVVVLSPTPHPSVVGMPSETSSRSRSGSQDGEEDREEDTTENGRHRQRSPPTTWKTQARASSQCPSPPKAASQAYRSDGMYVSTVRTTTGVKSGSGGANASSNSYPGSGSGSAAWTVSSDQIPIIASGSGPSLGSPIGSHTASSPPTTRSGRTIDRIGSSPTCPPSTSSYSSSSSSSSSPATTTAIATKLHPTRPNHGPHPLPRDGVSTGSRRAQWTIEVDRIDPGMDAWVGVGDPDEMGFGRVVLVLGDAPSSSIDHLRRSPHMRDTLLILPESTGSSDPSIPGSRDSSSGAFSKLGATGGNAAGSARPSRPTSKLRLSHMHSSTSSSGSVKGSSTATARAESSSSSGRRREEEIEVDVYPTIRRLRGPGLERSIRSVLDDAASLARTWRSTRPRNAGLTESGRRSRTRGFTTAATTRLHSRASSNDSTSSYEAYTPSTLFGSPPLASASAVEDDDTESLDAPRPRYAHAHAHSYSSMGSRSGSWSDASSVRSQRTDDASASGSGSRKRMSIVPSAMSRRSGKATRASAIGRRDPAVQGAGRRTPPPFDVIISFTSVGRGGGRAQGQAAAQAMVHDALVLIATSVPMLAADLPIRPSSEPANEPLPPRLIQVIPHHAPDQLAGVLDSYLASTLEPINAAYPGRTDGVTGYIIHQRVLDKPIQRQGSTERSSPFDLLLSGALSNSATTKTVRSDQLPSLYLDSFRDCRFTTGPTSRTASPVVDTGDAPLPRALVGLDGSREGSVSDSLSIPGLASETDSASSREIRPTTPSTPTPTQAWSVEVEEATPGTHDAGRSEVKRSRWISKVFRRKNSLSGGSV